MEAKRLLKESPESIESIAQKMAFSSIEVFSRFFKRVAGKSPKNFRKQFAVFFLRKNKISLRKNIFFLRNILKKQRDFLRFLNFVPIVWKRLIYTQGIFYLYSFIFYCQKVKCHRHSMVLIGFYQFWGIIKVYLCFVYG